MADPREILKKNTLFKAADEKETEELTARAVEDTVHFETGEKVYSPDGMKKAAGIVLSGTVIVNRQGDETVRLNTLKPGDVFGIAGLFATNAEKSNGTVTEVVAAAPADIWFIPGETIRKMIRENPDFAESYITYLSQKIRFLNKRIADFTAACAETKTARYLGELVKNSKDGTLTFKVNMSALAKTLDIGRASLYRALACLEAKNIIRRTEGRIEIIAPDRLAEQYK
ncbi:MAG: Crp/Fnr family transcriptional regulator [Clostridia bacterium]|nr:Crp/Fnr family transcriptional regulator [Clostridia bacterium]